MTRRHYSNTAASASAAVLVGAADTSIALADFSGFPSEPFIAALDKDTTDEEIVLVTAVAGSTVTVTRGYDGTLAKAHAAGASFRHVASAKDFDEANAHVNATSGVHGLSGSVVGTSDEQTLSNKTLTAPTISNPTFTGTASGVGASFSGTVSGATGSFTTLTVTGDASVTGGLDVDGATTLAGLTAGASQFASAAVTGNVTVGGTLGVSGALSGASAGFSGTVSAPSSAITTMTTDEVELEQQATDLAAAASHSSLYAKTNFGLYFRPNGQTTRRAAMHWGTVSTLPTTGAIAGDTANVSTVNGALLRYNGTNWRQIDGPVHIANMAARPANNATGLHAGFSVWDTSTSRLYVFDGTYWRMPITGDYVPSGATAGDYITGVSGSTTIVTSGSGGINVSHGQTFSASPDYVQCTPGSTGSGDNLGFFVPQVGLHTASAVNVRVFKQDGSPLLNSTIRINYLVIGRND